MRRYALWRYGADGARAARAADGQTPAVGATREPTRSERWNRVARMLETPEKILAALRARGRRERNRDLARPAQPPRSATERRLCDIWSEVLGLHPIGVADDYHDDLGGSSLQAVEIFARIERDLGVRLPLVALLELPTVAKLALRIDRPRGFTSLVALHDEGSGLPLFLIHDGDGENPALSQPGRAPGGSPGVRGAAARPVGDAHHAYADRGHGSSLRGGDTRAPAAGPLSPGRPLRGRGAGLRDGAAIRGRG